MRILASLALLGLFVLTAVAQDKRLPPIPMDGAPGVQILGTFLGSSSADRGANFSIEIRNSGKATIKAVSWEYYLSLPSGKDTVDIRVSPTTEGLTIRPGETKMLRATVRNILDPVVSFVPPTKIRLMRLDYEGATSWHRPTE